VSQPAQPCQNVLIRPGWDIIGANGASVRDFGADMASQMMARRGRKTDGMGEARRKPTINDVARLAGVSKKTVSRVINQSPSVRDETRARIDAIIAELGFTPDPQARGLAFRRSFLVGLVYDNPNAQYIVNVQQGVLNALRGSGVELVVHPCDRFSADLHADARTFIERQKLAGVIVLPPLSEDAAFAEMLREIDCPYVRVASVELDSPEAMIISQERDGATQAAEHLAALGHRRIGYIGGHPQYRSARERRDGFVAGLERGGLTADPALMAQGDYSFESGQACAGALLDLRSPPTAIFAANDEMATGVYHAAQARGLSIPGDLSVVGFDDHHLAARLVPPLSTVRLPTRDVGRLAAEKLVALAAREPDRRTTLVEASLIERQSSAPPT
jgi:LacI family transcriptional regulator